MDNAITKLDIFPDYSGGFLFMWELAGDFNVEQPWVFHVEQSKSPSDSWIDISGPVINQYFYKETGRSLINKSSVLYFRVVLDAGGKRYFSSVLQPYGDIVKKDYLIAREIMRKEVLHMRGLAGVAGSVYSLATFGPACRFCRDPITGEIRDSDCKKCFGTGRLHPYSGPYDCWMSFSEDSKHQHQDDGVGTFEHKMFNVRLVANPVVKKNDVLIDRGSDKRYYVNQAQVVAEIRRIPVVQNLVVMEAPVSDKIYELK